MSERRDVVERMQAWLDATQHIGEHEVTVLGRVFVVPPGVFSPRYYPETGFYAAHVLEAVRPGDRFLDLGCGAGVNAVLAAAKGVSVVACDVNDQAVETTRRNAARHGVAVDVRLSDIFSAVRDEAFDVVYWNIPFTFREPATSLRPLEEAIFDPGYRKNLRFLREVRGHLAPGGAVLVGVSSTLGELPTILAAGAESGLDFIVRAESVEAGTDPPTSLQFLAARPVGARPYDDDAGRGDPSSGAD